VRTAIKAKSTTEPNSGFHLEWEALTKTEIKAYVHSTKNKEGHCPECPFEDLYAILKLAKRVLRLHIKVDLTYGHLLPVNLDFDLHT
jgi:hypothetical protein